MSAALCIIGYIATALLVEYVAARLGWDTMGLGLLWPVMVPLGLLLVLIQYVSDLGNEHRWRQ